MCAKSGDMCASVCTKSLLSNLRIEIWNRFRVEMSIYGLNFDTLSMNVTWANRLVMEIKWIELCVIVIDSYFTLITLIIRSISGETLYLKIHLVQFTGSSVIHNN